MSSTAGGRATEAGMGFQAMVGTWFAAHLIADHPVGSRFGLATAQVATEIQFESDAAVDDIVATLDDGRKIYVQCKTNLSLDKGAESALGKTLAQLVRLYRATSLPAIATVVLATSDGASRSLDKLESACRAFDLGETWDSVHGRLPDDRLGALDLFKAHVDRAWQADSSGASPSNTDLAQLASLFRITRFGDSQTSADWREIATLFGTSIYENATIGHDAAIALLDTVRKLIRSGAAGTKYGLLDSLRKAGFKDIKAPRFDCDIAALKRYSDDERRRLGIHSRLGQNLAPIKRDCLDSLSTAATGGSLLVVGEPGAGKTGVLVSLAEHLTRAGGPVLLLAVDRLAGITKSRDLQYELGLQNSFLDVLANWPGDAPGYLIIDALDATRGALSEGVIATLIEDAMARLHERWSIIASIRTFDLQNGLRFRQLMRGSPPDPAYLEEGQKELTSVRHFKIKWLSDAELSALALASPALGDLLKNPPISLRGLLRNIFNLSIAQNLLEGGLPSAQIGDISTQSQLIDAYEDLRMGTPPLKQAAKITVERMVARHRLTVPQTEVVHDALTDLLHSGVLMTPGRDNLAFAHHVLFDHIASRFYFEREDSALLLKQIAEIKAEGLFLGPALRFTLERIWQEDDAHRAKFWTLLFDFAKVPALDPIVASISLRAAAASVRSKDDIVGLCAIIDFDSDKKTVGLILSKLARFAKIAFDETEENRAEIALAWATVAETAAKHKVLELADGVRFILWILFEKADFNSAPLLNTFGVAARALLQFAWTQTINLLSTNAIRFVAKSYVSDVEGSRVLLQQIIDEPRFAEHAYLEAPWLAEGLGPIMAHDPDFAVRIYEVLFTREVPQDGKSWFGGAQSRILPLVSNRRQDYEHARWHLARHLKKFLVINPAKAAEAAIVASRFAARDGGSTRYELVEIPLRNGSTLRLSHNQYSLQDWRESSRRGNEEDLLSHFVAYLKQCTPGQFGEIVAVAKGLVTGSEIWIRLLGVATERTDIPFDCLWDEASTPQWMALQGLTFDTVGYLLAKYASVPEAQRAAFEQAVLAYETTLSTDANKKWWRAVQGRFLSTIPTDTLVTDRLRALKHELARENKLQGNTPLVTFTSGWSDGEEMANVLIERQGADLKEGSNPELRSASSALETSVKAGIPSTDETLVALWNSVKHVVETIDRVGGQAHEATIHAAWAAVSNAAEHVAKSDAFKPGTGHHPGADEFIDLVERLSASAYPKANEEGRDEEGSLAWGNWDVRVYAASSTLNFAREHPTIALRRCMPLLYRFLADPVASVRLQVAQAINTFWDSSRDDVWKMLETVAASERNVSVLSFFIGGPLNRLAHSAPDRVESLLATVLERLPTLKRSEHRSTGDFGEQAGGLMSLFFVKFGRSTARAWLEGWWSDIAANESFVLPIIGSLEPVYVLTYGGNADAEDAPAVQARGKELLDAAIERAIAAMNRAAHVLRQGGTDEERKPMEELYTAGDRLLNQCCSHLFFASGASREMRRGDSDENSPFDKARFFNDYQSTLGRIAARGTPATVHQMVDMYAYLAEVAPDRVFDGLATMLAGQAARDGYQYESLAADAFVKLIRRYLADHRDVFEDPTRSRRLIEVLEVFSNAGWPEALQLLYELPDLMR